MNMTSTPQKIIARPAEGACLHTEHQKPLRDLPR
jgi:hypothetical protein